MSTTRRLTEAEVEEVRRLQREGTGFPRIARLVWEWSTSDDEK